MCMGTSNLYSCLVVQVGNLNVNVLSTVSWSGAILHRSQYFQFDSNCFHHSSPILPPRNKGSVERLLVQTRSYDSKAPGSITFVGDTDRFSDLFCVHIGNTIASMRNNSSFLPVVIGVECVVAGKNGRNKCNWTYWRWSRTVRPPDSPLGLGFTEKVSKFQKFLYTKALCSTVLLCLMEQRKIVR